MADLSYNVKVNTQDAERSITGLKTALGGLAAAFSIRAIVQFGDSITNLQNKLRVLTPAAGDVQKQFAALLQIADQSRAPLGAVGDLYFRIARAADTLGISQREAALITDTLSKGLVASGLSAQEAAGPLLQLGQALQSGRFQGDELRSILEGLPIVAQALADEMGVPIGRLRQLGAEGKITGDVFVAAMQKARGGIVDAFGRTLPTVGQSIERLQTNLARLFANIGGNEALAGLAAAVGRVADSLQPLGEFIRRNGEELAQLAKIVGIVSVSLALFTRGAKLVQTAQSAMIAVVGLANTKVQLMGTLFGGAARAATNFAKALGIVAITGGKLNKLGYFIAAIGAGLRTLLRFAGVAGIIYAIAEAIDFVVKSLSGFSILDWVLGKFRELGQWLGIISKEQNTNNKETKDAVAALDDQAKKVREVVQATAEQIYAVEELKQAYRDTARNQEDSLRISNQLIGAGELQRNLVDNLRTSYENYANQRKAIEKEITDLTVKGNEEERAKIPLLMQALDDLNARYQENLQTIKELTFEQERLTQARALEEFTLKRQQDQTDALIRLQREMARMSMTEIEKKYADIEAAADDAARAAIRAEEARRGAPLSQQEQEEYYRRARVGNEQLKKQTQELYERSRDFSTGWKRAMRDYVEEVTNGAKRAENLFKKATQGMEDAIVGFVKTGKFEWKDFVNMMLEELLRANIQSVFAGIFGAARPTAAMGGGGGGGNLIGSILGALGGSNNRSVATPPINGGGGGSFLGDIGSWINKNLFGGFFANGGMIPAGKFGVVGERGPELVGGPANITPMGATQITYNINAVDAASFQQLVARDPQFIYAVTEQGRQSIARRR